MSNTTDTTGSYDAWLNQDVYDPTGTKIGSIDEIFYDDQTGRPEWITIKSGLFGTKKHFVPIIGSSSRQGGGLTVNYSIDVVKDAPGVDADYGHLSATDEEMLYKHYNIAWDDTSQFDVTTRADNSYPVPPLTREGYVTEERAVTGEDRVVTGEESMTAVTEVPRIEEQRQTVRLRKYQITEMVPVTREEIRVEKGETTSTEDVVTETTTAPDGTVTETTTTEEQYRR